MFVVFHSSQSLAQLGDLSYYLSQMSDFEADLNQKHESLLVEAMALDFMMWRAKTYKARKPWVRVSGESEAPYYGGLPNYASETDLVDHAKQFEAELVEQVYWQGKPAPRRSKQGRPETIASLLGDEVKPHVSFQIRELADRLHISEKHVRRKLGELDKVGKIPAGWRVGKQWRPPVDEAEIIIRSAGNRGHKPHTHAAADTYAEFLVRCRRDAERMKCELGETWSKLETCKDWIRLTRRRGLSAAEYDKARELAFFTMSQMAERRRWSFCKLFVGMYAAMLNGSAKPVGEAKSFLGLNHAAFYRIYTKQHVLEARKLAERMLANPDWTSFTSQAAENANDDSPPFSDWSDKVSEQDLWVEVQ